MSGYGFHKIDPDTFDLVLTNSGAPLDDDTLLTEIITIARNLQEWCWYNADLKPFLPYEQKAKTTAQIDMLKAHAITLFRKLEEKGRVTDLTVDVVLDRGTAVLLLDCTDTRGRPFHWETSIVFSS